MLALCIQDEIVEIEKKQNRPAFLQYLKDAPPVNVIEGEGSDPTKCGDLREYFEYDRDYADDDRICEEVKDLKVRRRRMNAVIKPPSLSISLTNLSLCTVPYRLFKLGRTCNWSARGQ